MLNSSVFKITVLWNQLRMIFYFIFFNIFSIIIRNAYCQHVFALISCSSACKLVIAYLCLVLLYCRIICSWYMGWNMLCEYFLVWIYPVEIFFLLLVCIRCMMTVELLTYGWINFSKLCNLSYFHVLCFSAG